MALRSNEEWINLFIENGIPEDKSREYANVFVRNELCNEDVADLGRDGLKELGITVIGHSLKILRLTRSTSSNTAAGSSSNRAIKPKPPDPPAKVTLDMTRSRFQKFIADWNRHKKSCGITNYMNIHIYNLCDESVQTIIHNTHATFEEKTEEEFLNILKKIVTQQCNPRVHRCQFMKLTQNPAETMKNFATRLQTTAVECEFKCKSCNANIEEQFVEDQFINGMRDNRIQMELFAKDTELESFQSIFTLAERLEAASRDQNKVSLYEDNVSRISEYQKHKKKQFTQGQGSQSQGYQNQW